MSLQVRVVDTVAATESVVDLIQPIGVCGRLTETGSVIHEKIYLAKKAGK